MTKKALSILLILALLIGTAACSAQVSETTTPVISSTTSTSTTTTTKTEETVVVFNDPVLEAKVRSILEIPEGEISIAQAKEVTYFNLNGGDPWVADEDKITDISALAYFTNLTYLDLRWNNIEDLTPLSGLTTLQQLYLDSNLRISDFSPLTGLTSIIDFQTSGYEGLLIDDSNIGFIAGMTGMQALHIQGASGLSDLSALANFHDLEYLNLENCNIKDLSPLSGLTKLKEVHLLGNPISDFSPLKDVYASLDVKDFEIINPEDVPDEPILFQDEQLEASIRQILNINDRPVTQRDAYMVLSLDISSRWDTNENKISNIADLAYFKNLKSLTCDFQEVTDISALSGLVKMEKISFSGNHVNDISALKDMTSLTEVNFFGNRISDISVLAGKYGINNLTIFANQISDISPLAGMHELGMLRMEDNQISDISVVSQLTGLAILTLKGNPISDFSPVKDIYPQLREKDFEMN